MNKPDADDMAYELVDYALTKFLQLFTLGMVLWLYLDVTSLGSRAKELEGKHGISTSVDKD